MFHRFHSLDGNHFFFMSLRPRIDPSTAPTDGASIEGADEDDSPGRARQTVDPALHGCTLQVQKGELVAIVGAVGSGKSR